MLAMVGLAVGGFGLGMAVSALVTRRRRHQLTRLGVRMRVAVLPLLEEHAHQMEVGHDLLDDDDPIARVLALAKCIKTHQEQQKLPFSDTLEVSRSDVADELREDKRRA